MVQELSKQALSMKAWPGSRGDLSRLTVDETAKWGRRIEFAGIKPNAIAGWSDVRCMSFGPIPTRPVGFSHVLRLREEKRAGRVRDIQHSVIQSQAVLIAVGIDWEGRHSLLGVELASRESRASWRAFLMALKERGLRGHPVRGLC